MESSTKEDKALKYMKFALKTVFFSYLLKAVITRAGFVFTKIAIGGRLLAQWQVSLGYFVLLLLGIGVHLQCRARRSLQDEVILACLPIGSSILLSNFSSLRYLLLAFLLFLLIFWRIDVWHLRNRKQSALQQGRRLKHKRSMQRLLRQSVYRIEFFALGVVLVAFAGFIFGQLKATSTIPVYTMETEVPELEMLLKNHEAEVSVLQIDSYALLSQQDRQKALQVLLDIEMQHLGCQSVQLVTEEIAKRENTYIYVGYYNHEERKVVIDESVLQESLTDTISILLHEAFHVYQYACCEEVNAAKSDLLFYREVRQWARELQDYHDMQYDSLEEYELYSQQKLEQTAREYSEKWLPVYQKLLHQMED